MAAISSVTIANRALQRLGATFITSLTQNHPNAASISTAYDMTRRRMLRLYAWSFAKQRASIPALTTQTIYGALNQFPLPADFIRLLRYKGPAGTNARHDWEIENVPDVGPCIITSDGAPLQFMYIYDAQTESQFDALFAEAFACQLAYECCEEITGSNSKRQLLLQDLKSIIKDARYANAIERDADVELTDDWMLAMQAMTAGPNLVGLFD